MKLQSGILVYDNHWVPVQLQTGQRPHVVDPALDRLLKGHRLVGTGDDNDDLVSLWQSVTVHHVVKRHAHLQDRLNAHCQGHPGDFGKIIAKEARVGEDGVVRQRLDPSARLEAGSRLIEGKVAIRSNATQEQLDTTDLLDLLLVCVAFRFEVRSIAIEDVDIGGLNIYMVEEMLVHEAVVGLRVFARDPDVLVLWTGQYP